MGKDIIFKLGKPGTKEEVQNLKQFRVNLKAFLNAKRGKIKVIEKFKDYTVTIYDCAPHEEQRIAIFLKENKTVEVLQLRHKICF